MNTKGILITLLLAFSLYAHLSYAEEHSSIFSIPKNVFYNTKMFLAFPCNTPCAFLLFAIGGYQSFIVYKKLTRKNKQKKNNWIAPATIATIALGTGLCMLYNAYITKFYHQNKDKDEEDNTSWFKSFFVEEWVYPSN